MHTPPSKTIPSAVLDDAPDLQELYLHLKTLGVKEWQWLDLVLYLQQRPHFRWTPIHAPVHLMRLPSVDVHEHKAPAEEDSPNGTTFVELVDRSKQYLSKPLWVVRVLSVYYIRTKDLEEMPDVLVALLPPDTPLTDANLDRGIRPNPLYVALFDKRNRPDMNKKM